MACLGLMRPLPLSGSALSCPPPLLDGHWAQAVTIPHTTARELETELLRQQVRGRGLEMAHKSLRLL